MISPLILRAYNNDDEGPKIWGCVMHKVRTNAHKEVYSETRGQTHPRPRRRQTEPLPSTVEASPSPITLPNNIAFKAEPGPVASINGHVRAPLPQLDSSSLSLRPASTASIASSASHSPQTAASYKKTPVQLFRTIILSNWLNLLLVCCPVGFAVHFANVNPTAVFVVNMFAIVPLAGLLSYATEELSVKTGPTLGALLNVTLGNAVELIINTIALVQNKIELVQAALLGSMLSCLLLVLGMSFFVGGLRHKEQAYNMTIAQTSTVLHTIAVAAFIIPASFHLSVANSDSIVEQISRGTSIILLLVYCTYLYFQLKSHASLYEESSVINAEGSRVSARNGEELEEAEIPPFVALIL